MLKTPNGVDSPIKNSYNDALGLNDYAEALSNMILNTPNTPITIGIGGDWGSGKTSLMNMIEHKIRSVHKNIRTLWFNAWQFSQFNMGDELSISLLSRFIREIENLGTETQEESKAKKALRLMVAGTVEMAGAGDAAKNIIESSDKIAELKKQLVDLVQEKRHTSQFDRIVVFIDDLDRLIPKKAVELLETLKVFLDIEGCVYVLACDRQLVAAGIKQKFGVDETKTAPSFFDKIIQVPFSMPVSEYNTDEFCQELLDRIGVTYELTDIGHYVKLINNSVGFNPRTVTRLFYNLLLFNKIVEKMSINDPASQPNDRVRMLFAKLCLQESFNPMYKYLLQADINAELFTKKLSIPEVLKEASEFAVLRAEFREELERGDFLFLSKLAHFMAVLFVAISKSDLANEIPIQEKIATFRTILSFSNETGMADGQDESEQQADYDAYTERALNRELIKGVISEIESRYQMELKQLAPIMSKFKKWQPRYGDDDLSISAWAKVTSSNNKSGILLSLYLDAGSHGSTENGEKYIGYGFEGASGYFNQKWFKDNFKKTFPEAFYDQEDEGSLHLHAEELSPDISREQLDSTFIKTTFEVLDKLLPRLVQLHKEGKC
ncbi:MAG: hypothetical protein DRR19_28145 [Candidatus Parabeggiatoa sp. nov. 1]|nr:MAG: hypothetical protein DRR19_28145 [Gammaproteobacteria bacterium]